MKLIVQIPCLNEAATLPATLAELPDTIEGINTIEVLVIDDASTDGTAEVARNLGVHHIVRNKRNLGLARSFRRGLETALAAGADVIVNTDGDGQYAGEDIPALAAPIIAGDADIVVGDRQTAGIPHFSPIKKRLQHLGSLVVRRLSSTDIPDAVCGFRAVSREAALRLNIVSTFSYTTEMIIQAGRRSMAITSVPIQTRKVERESRLFRSIPHFIVQTAGTMLRTYAMYQPLRLFFYIGTTLALIGLAPALRFLYFYATGDGAGHIQSLVLGGAFLVMGFVSYTVGLVADLIANNRKLLERQLESSRRREWGDSRPSHPVAGKPD